MPGEQGRFKKRRVVAVEGLSGARFGCCRSGQGLGRQRAGDGENPHRLGPGSHQREGGLPYSRGLRSPGDRRSRAHQGTELFGTGGLGGHRCLCPPGEDPGHRQWRHPQRPGCCVPQEKHRRFRGDDWSRRDAKPVDFPRSQTFPRHGDDRCAHDSGGALEAGASSLRAGGSEQASVTH